MTFDFAFILSTLPAFLKAVGVTLQVGLIAIATSLLVALINAALLVFRTPYLSRLVALYVELARNTPLLIQLFFVYFALPALGFNISGFWAAIITMTFLGGAYLTEVLRAGVEADQPARGAHGVREPGRGGLVAVVGEHRVFPDRHFARDFVIRIGQAERNFEAQHAGRA